MREEGGLQCKGGILSDKVDKKVFGGGGICADMSRVRREKPYVHDFISIINK